MSMDVSSISSYATQASQSRTADAVGMTVLKKALDSQQSAAVALINTVTPSRSLPSHLGQNVNTVA
jgi:hypothetical protein